MNDELEWTRADESVCLFRMPSNHLPKTSRILFTISSHKTKILSQFPTALKPQLVKRNTAAGHAIGRCCIMLLSLLTACITSTINTINLSVTCLSTEPVYGQKYLAKP